MSTPTPQDAHPPEPQLPPPRDWGGFARRNREHICDRERSIEPESAARIHQLVEQNRHRHLLPPEYLPELVEAVGNVTQALYAAVQLIDTAVEREPRVEQSLLGVAGRCPDLLAEVIAHNNVICRVMSDARELVVAAHPWLSDLAAKYLGAKPHEWTGGFALLFDQITGPQVACMLSGRICDLRCEITRRIEHLRLMCELSARAEFAKKSPTPTGSVLSDTERDVVEVLKGSAAPLKSHEIAAKLGHGTGGGLVRKAIERLVGNGIKIETISRGPRSGQGYVLKE
jgi:hypothetical protein